MTTLTRRELEQFSDAAGQRVADTDRGGMPIAERHLARFRELQARRNRQQVTRQVVTIFDKSAYAYLEKAVVLQCNSPPFALVQ